MGSIGAKITRVIPAKAGIHLEATQHHAEERSMPASAGMTIGCGVNHPELAVL
jgi:hypothetical protein